MNYKDVATAIFTPLEIGTIGLSEEEALAKVLCFTILSHRCETWSLFTSLTIMFFAVR